MSQKFTAPKNLASSGAQGQVGAGAEEEVGLDTMDWLDLMRKEDVNVLLPRKVAESLRNNQNPVWVVADMYKINVIRDAALKNENVYVSIVTTNHETAAKMIKPLNQLIIEAEIWDPFDPVFQIAPYYYAITKFMKMYAVVMEKLNAQNKVKVNINLTGAPPEIINAIIIAAITNPGIAEKIEKIIIGNYEIEPMILHNYAKINDIERKIICHIAHGTNTPETLRLILNIPRSTLYKILEKLQKNRLIYREKRGMYKLHPEIQKFF